MKHITAPWLLINSEGRIIILKNPKKSANICTAGKVTGRWQRGRKYSKVEGEVFFDPNEIKLHPGRQSALLSGGFAWKSMQRS